VSDRRPPYSRTALLVTLAIIIALVAFDHLASAA